jgi:hypothetical protein
LDANGSGLKLMIAGDEKGKIAMTLTPPRASERAAGNRSAGLLVAERSGKTNDEPMKQTKKTSEQAH